MFPITRKSFLLQRKYFKKITRRSLRMSSNHKLKDGDEIAQTCEFSNNGELLFFTDKCCHKAKAADFADTKASTPATSVPAKPVWTRAKNAVWLQQRIIRVFCCLRLRTVTGKSA